MGREGATAIILDEEFLPPAGPAPGVDPGRGRWADDPETVGDCPSSTASWRRRAGPDRPPRDASAATSSSRRGRPARPKGPGALRHGRSDALVSHAVQDPAAGRRRHRPGRGADLPLLGPGQRGVRPTARVGPGAAPPLRSRGHPAPHREASGPTVLVAVPVMIQRIMELPPEVRAALRHLVAAKWSACPAPRCPGSWPPASWTPSATSSTTCTGRPRSAGRRSPRPPTCGPRRARRARSPIGARGRASSTTTTATSAPGMAGQDLRAQRAAVRGLHRRRRQGRSSTGTCRPATSATSTRPGGSSSTVETTT